MVKFVADNNNDELDVATILELLSAKKLCAAVAAYCFRKNAALSANKSSSHSANVDEGESGGACSLVIGFARLLAAYYLGLPLPAPATRSTPNLFAWAATSPAAAIAENTEDDGREAIASRLPPDYTPRLVVELLWCCGRWLEALLFVDHFNDLRAQLILRRLIDLRLTQIKRASTIATCLFEQHCQATLVDDLLCAICRNGNTAESLSIGDIGEANTNGGSLVGRIRRHLDALLQIDVVFETRLLDDLKAKTMRILRDECTELEVLRDKETPLPHLKRPPIYATPLDTGSDGGAGAAWNRIHSLALTLIGAWGRCNQLEALSAYALIFAQKSMACDTIDGGGDSSAAASTLMMLEAEISVAGGGAELTDADWAIFLRLLAVVLWMETTDRLLHSLTALAMTTWRGEENDGANDGTETNVDTITLKALAYEREKARSLFEQVLRRRVGSNVNGGEDDAGEYARLESAMESWLRNFATVDDLDTITRFLHFIQESNSNSSRNAGGYSRQLPPLSGATRERWCSTLLSQVSLNNTPNGGRHTASPLTSLLAGNDGAEGLPKTRIPAREFLRLQCLHQRMPSIALMDEEAEEAEIGHYPVTDQQRQMPLIQIVIGLTPADLATPMQNEARNTDGEDADADSVCVDEAPGEEDIDASQKEAKNPASPSAETLLERIRQRIRGFSADLMPPAVSPSQKSEAALGDGHLKAASQSELERLAQPPPTLEWMLHTHKLERLKAELAEKRNALAELDARLVEDATSRKGTGRTSTPSDDNESTSLASPLVGGANEPDHVEEQRSVATTTTLASKLLGAEIEAIRASLSEIRASLEARSGDTGATPTVEGDNHPRNRHRRRHRRRRLKTSPPSTHSSLSSTPPPTNSNAANANQRRRRRKRRTSARLNTSIQKETSTMTHAVIDKEASMSDSGEEKPQRVEPPQPRRRHVVVVPALLGNNDGAVPPPTPPPDELGGGGGATSTTTPVRLARLDLSLLHTSSSGGDNDSASAASSSPSPRPPKVVSDATTAAAAAANKSEVIKQRKKRRRRRRPMSWTEVEVYPRHHHRRHRRQTPPSTSTPSAAGLDERGVLMKRKTMAIEKRTATAATAAAAAIDDDRQQKSVDAASSRRRPAAEAQRRRHRVPLRADEGRRRRRCLPEWLKLIPLERIFVDGEQSEAGRRAPLSDEPRLLTLAPPASTQQQQRHRRPVTAKTDKELRSLLRDGIGDRSAPPRGMRIDGDAGGDHRYDSGFIEPPHSALSSPLHRRRMLELPSASAPLSLAAAVVATEAKVTTPTHGVDATASDANANKETKLEEGGDADDDNSAVFYAAAMTPAQIERLWSEFRRSQTVARQRL